MLSRSLLQKVHVETTESLVVESPSVSSLDELRLELLKVIIEDKKKDLKEKEEFLQKQARKKRLLAIKAQKREEADLRLSEEDVDILLAELEE